MRGRTVVLVVLMALSTVVALSGTASATTPYRFVERAYTPLTPARVLDTRSGLGAPGPLGPQSTIELLVVGQGGVPTTGVGAVALNLTGTEPTAGTYVTAYPTGTARPTASTVNLTAGQTAPNMVLAKVGAGGKVSLYNFSGRVHLVADVVGWFGVGQDFTGLTPARLLDTRSPVRPVGADSAIDVRVTGLGGVPASGVGAVVVNLTGTEPTAGTYVTAYPTGEPRPTASTLNLVPGQTAPNLAVVKVGADGGIRLYNRSGSTHLIADVVGWFATGSDYAALTPTRLLDTRDGTGAPRGPVRADSSIPLVVTGRGGVPVDGVGAVVLNLTGTEPTAGTYVTAYPGGEARPTASNLNLTPGRTAPNLVIAKVGPDGRITLYNRSGSVHLLADVVGWISAGIQADVQRPDDTEVVDAGRVTAVSGTDVTVTGGAPAVGAIVVALPDATGQDGLLGRVTGTSGAPGGTLLRTEPVRITDAFPSGRVSGVLDSRALSPAGGSLSSGTVRTEADGTARVERRGAMTCGSHPIEVDVSLAVTAGLTFEVEWGLGGLRRMRISFGVEVEGSVSVTAQLGAKCRLPVAPEIPLGVIWGFKAAIQPVLDLELLGGLTTTASVRGRSDFGVVHTAGQAPRWIRDGGVTGSLTPPGLAAEGKAKVSFGPEASLKFASLAGPTFFAGLFSELTVSTAGTPWWRTDLGVELSAGVEIEVWFASVSYDLARADVLRFQLARAPGAWPGPRWTATALPAGQVAESYHAPLPVTGGTAPVVVEVTSGVLPPGLGISGGDLVGTPTQAGTFVLALAARDAQDRSTRQELTLVIAQPGQGGEPGPWAAHRAPLPADHATPAQAWARSVSCASTTCHVVGSYRTAAGVAPVAWSGYGDSWAVTAVPAQGQENLLDVTCASPTSCVAVGGDQSGARWHPTLVVGAGSTWTRVPVPLPPDADGHALLRAVACPATGDCVAMGFYHAGGNQQKVLVVHGRGTSWSAVGRALPAGADGGTAGVTRISCGTNACVGAGTYGSEALQSPVLVSGSGHLWSVTRPALPADASFNAMAYIRDVSCPATGDCTVVGSYLVPGGLRGLGIRGSDTTWTSGTVTAPGDENPATPETVVESVSCTTGTRCTATGSYRSERDRTEAAVFTLDGQWTGTAPPLSPTPSPTDHLLSHAYAVDCREPGRCTFLTTWRTESGQQAISSFRRSAGDWVVDGPMWEAPSVSGMIPYLGTRIDCSATLFCTGVSTVAAGNDTVPLLLSGTGHA